MVQEVQGAPLQEEAVPQQPSVPLEDSQEHGESAASEPLGNGDGHGDGDSGAMVEAGVSTVEDGSGGGELPSVPWDGFNHTPHHILTYEVKDNPTDDGEVHLEPEHPETPPATPDRRPSVPTPSLYYDPTFRVEIDEVCSPSKFFEGWVEPDNQLGLETPGVHAPNVTMDHGDSLGPEDHGDLDGSDIEIIDVIHNDPLDALTRAEILRRLNLLGELTTELPI